MQQRVAPVVLFCSLLISSGAAADDAYDDEAQQKRPDDAGFGDDAKPSQEEGLETGGLAAPDALGESGDSRKEIEKELEESDRKDSGRGLEFVWLSGDLGFQTIGLTTFGDAGLVPGAGDAGGSGFTYGGGLGVRVLYFTLGARFRNADFSAFHHWSLLAEAALRVPLGKLEPYMLLGCGYAGFSRLSGADGTGGVDLRLGGGLDYYLSDSFSVGAQVGGDVLFLSNSLGTGTGAGFSSAALLGLHF